MKRYISYIACLALSIIAIGCVKSDIGSDIEQGGELTLQFSNSAPTTRATRANDSSNNEDLLKSVQLFFYPKGSESSNAVYTHTVYNFPTTDAEGNASTANTANKSTTVTIKISAGDLANMFPNNATECSVYAIANGPTPATNAKTDVESLKAMSIEADFTTTTQESFVMDSDICTIKKDGKNLSGTVELTRAAAKIELAVSASNIVIDGKTYMPQIANMKVALLSGVKKGLVDDGSDETPVDHNVAADYFNIDIDAGRGFTNGVQTTPFYSYSSKWEAGDEDEATLKLMIPWGVSADGTTAPSSYLNYIYEVPVNDLGKSIVRNKYYKITLNVGVLGSLNEEHVKLNPSYVVLDWGTGEVDVELSRPKYLVVDENYVEIFNQNSYSIGYNSSEPVTITVDKIVFNSYRYANTRTVTITRSGTTISPNATLTVNDKYADYSAVNDTTNYEVDFSHAMSANTFVPHEIYITVKHTNDTTGAFSEQIVIKQYPSIYIVSDKSNGKVFVNKDSSGSVYDDRGSSRGTYLGSIATGVSGSDTGTNDNQNMYNVYISSLPSSSTSIIGDPRVEQGTTVSNISGLTNYRPTRQGAENVIAPAFKIASSWGKTQDLSSYTAAEMRCASYQESGYPAGRWRVPTPAEIAFIQERSANNDIPSLFNGAVYSRSQYSGYWTSYELAYWPGYETPGRPTGPNAGAYTTNEVNCSEHAVRCVYDIWYWGEGRVQSALTTAQWGDAKTNDQF